MRCEDRTLREPKLRWYEHRGLRQVLVIVNVPDFARLYRFLEVLEDQTIVARWLASK